MKLKKQKSERYREGEKRQYFPYVLEWKCEECGEKHNHNFNTEYLSYPQWGETYTQHLYCHECGSEEQVVLLLPEVTLKIVKD